MSKKNHKEPANLEEASREDVGHKKSVELKDTPSEDTELEVSMFKNVFSIICVSVVILFNNTYVWIISSAIFALVIMTKKKHKEPLKEPTPKELSELDTALKKIFYTMCLCGVVLLTVPQWEHFLLNDAVSALCPHTPSWNYRHCVDIYRFVRFLLLVCVTIMWVSSAMIVLAHKVIDVSIATNLPTPVLVFFAIGTALCSTSVLTIPHLFFENERNENLYTTFIALFYVAMSWYISLYFKKAVPLEKKIKK
jgi:hypothetical protein